MSRSSRTCRRAAEVRWTVESHPTLIYCRSRQHVLGSLVANLHQYDLAAPDAADAVAHINDLLRVDGGIVTPIYYWACLNTEIAPSHASSIRKLLDAGAHGGALLFKFRDHYLVLSLGLRNNAGCLCVPLGDEFVALLDAFTNVLFVETSG